MLARVLRTWSYDPGTSRARLDKLFPAVCRPRKISNASRKRENRPSLERNFQVHLELGEGMANHWSTGRSSISTPALFLVFRSVTGNVFWLSDHELRAANPLNRYSGMIITQERLLRFLLLGCEPDGFSFSFEFS